MKSFYEMTQIIEDMAGFGRGADYKLDDDLAKIAASKKFIKLPPERRGLKVPGEVNENYGRNLRTTEITVAAGDDETFEKYGDEIDFVIDVTWSREGELEDFEDARIKEARLAGSPMRLNPELIAFGIKKLKEGWGRYSREIADKEFRPREEDYDFPEREPWRDTEFNNAINTDPRR